LLSISYGSSSIVLGVLCPVHVKQAAKLFDGCFSVVTFLTSLISSSSIAKSISSKRFVNLAS
jgi:hypothetical protein